MVVVKFLHVCESCMYAFYYNNKNINFFIIDYKNNAKK